MRVMSIECGSVTELFQYTPPGKSGFERISALANEALGSDMAQYL